MCLRPPYRQRHLARGRQRAERRPTRVSALLGARMTPSRGTLWVVRSRSPNRVFAARSSTTAGLRYVLALPMAAHSRSLTSKQLACPRSVIASSKSLSRASMPLMQSRLCSPIRYSGMPVTWPQTTQQTLPLPLVTRAVALRKGTDGWMHSLMSRLPTSGLAPNDAAAEAYLDALAEVLSDGRITREEAKILAGLAGSAGMGGEQIAALNRRFLEALKVAALDDDVLTAAEIRHMRTAAKALSMADYFGELQPTAPAKAEPRTPDPSGEVSVGNSMEARAQRGVRALEMQRAGDSRDEIAAAIGVSPGTVKSLLRDAKFYENPQSDPSRLALGRDARRARDSGMTRDAFQDDRGLTSGKSGEAWRDAAMLAQSL